MGPHQPSTTSPEAAIRPGKVLPRVRVQVPAKINLALCVGGLQPDGYHRLGTVFHAVSLFDEVIARPVATPGIVLTARGEGAEALPVDASNLAHRAAQLLLDRFPETEGGIELELRKQIPVAGGMAGGSADAAATLLACSIAWDLDTTPAELHELASELGSDVPFALHGGNALGAGRGTELMPLLSRGNYHWVLALSHAGLSTPAVFARFDERGDQPDTQVPQGLLNALAVGDVRALAGQLRNDLQPAAIDLRPELGEVLEYGLRAGAPGSILSGSGPTCAFLAESEEQAMDVASALSSHPQVRAVRRASGPVPGARQMV